MKGLFSSPRTTTFGLLTLLAALGLLSTCFINQFDADPETIPQWERAWEALAIALAGVGIIGARDNNKTSEDVGAK